MITIQDVLGLHEDIAKIREERAKACDFSFEIQYHKYMNDLWNTISEDNGVEPDRFVTLPSEIRLSQRAQAIYQEACEWLQEMSKGVENPCLTLA